MKKQSKKSLKDFQNSENLITTKAQKVKLKGGIVVDDLTGL